MMHAFIHIYTHVFIRIGLPHLWFAEKTEILYGEYRKWVGGAYKPYGTPEMKNRSLRVKTGEVATLYIHTHVCCVCNRMMTIRNQMLSGLVAVSGLRTILIKSYMSRENLVQKAKRIVLAKKSQISW
jgi:hypothetical protein